MDKMNLSYNSNLKVGYKETVETVSLSCFYKPDKISSTYKSKSSKADHIV